MTGKHTDRARDLVYDARITVADRINRVVATGAQRWLLHHPEDDLSRLLPLPPREKIVEETISQDHGLGR